MRNVGFNPHGPTNATASELRRALKDSEADGLDPRDYHLPVLEELAAAADAGAAYEILHTDALLRIADHLLFGKVDAATFDAHWNYTRNPIGIDIPQRIERALASDDIYAEIEKLKPTHRNVSVPEAGTGALSAGRSRAPSGSPSRRASRSSRTRTMNVCWRCERA